MASSRLNLKNVTGVLVDRDTFTRGLIAQMLRGFGISNILVAASGAEAKELVLANRTDICFVEGALPDTSAADFIRWIRGQASNPLRFVPVIVLSGYTQLRLIAQARDGGAHTVIKKPVSPQTLFDRIGWAANFSRPFLETPKYIGPDRRFHNLSPPDSKMKRETDINTNREADGLARVG
jgi:CheY-like chemotaxis protein